MKIKLGSINIYITRYRMKRRGKVDDMRRNYRNILKRIKKQMYGRLGGRCSVCGGLFKLEEMQLHHIKPCSKNPELLICRDNLQIVCRECHKKLHNHEVNVGREVSEL